MDKKQEQSMGSQQGSGSSENIGRNRSAQEDPKTGLSQEERQNIAGELDEDPERIGDIEETGATSGRDDYSGGFNDGMDDQDTGEETDR